jgi:predicted thioesterase
MNLQALSEVVLSERFSVPALPHAEAVQDDVFKSRFTAVFNTAYLLATIEGFCAEELADCVSPVHETVTGTGVDFKHIKAATCDAPVFVKGYVVEVADRAVIFFASATQHGETIGAGTLRFAIMARSAAPIDTQSTQVEIRPGAKVTEDFLSASPRFDRAPRSSRIRSAGAAGVVQCSL